MLFLELPENVLNRGRDEKILLLQPQLASLGHFVAGIEDLGDVLAQDLGFDGAHVVALVKLLEVEFPA